MIHLKLLIPLILVIVNLSTEVLSLNKPDSIFYSLSGLSDEQKVDSISSIMNRYRNNYPTLGIELGKEALIISDSINYLSGKANIMDKMGVLYRKLSDYNLALEYHFEALRYFENLDDMMGKAFALTNIGNVYWRIDKFDLALKYFSMSLKIKEDLEDESQISYTLNSIGLTYEKIGRLDSAKTFLLRTLEIKETLNDELGIANALHNLADIELKLNQLDAAEFKLRKAYEFYNKNDSKYGQTVVSKSLSELFIAKNDVGKSLIYLNKGLELALFLNAKDLEKEFYQLYSEYYGSIGSYRKAFEYMKQYIELSEEIYSKDNLNLVSSSETLYHLKKKDYENQLLKQQNKIKGLLYNQQSYNVYFLWSVSFVIIVFLIILIIRNRKILKINYELRKQQEDLNVTNEELKRLNAIKNKFFSIISHDLKNPFQFLINSSSLMNYEYHNLTDDEKKEFLKGIERVSRDSYELLSNLLKWSSIQTGKIKTHLTLFELNKLIQYNINLCSKFSVRKNIIINNDVNDDLLAFADEEMISTVIRNLIINSIKYSYDSGKIFITAKEIDRMIEISVRDEGVGLTEDGAANLFQIVEIESRPGTAEEKGTGLGLILCKEIVEENGGEIGVDYETEKGCRFYFTIPKARPS